MKVINLTMQNGYNVYVVAANIIWLEPHANGTQVHTVGDALIVTEPIEAIAVLIATW